MSGDIGFLISAWKAEGSPAQIPLNWHSQRISWVSALGDFENTLSKLPASINREFLFNMSASQEFDISQKFLAVMLWGYGGRGYGPYRVSKMLEQPNVLIKLENVYELCKSQFPIDAYRYLMAEPIRGLGPSYATKLLNFLTPREVGSPILDSLILKWIKENVPREFDTHNLNRLKWNPHLYSHYSYWVKENAASHGCLPDQVELVMFNHIVDSLNATSVWKNPK